MCCAWRVARPIDSPPDDVDALRTLALNAIAERDAAIAERDRLIKLNDRLRRLLRKAQGFEAKSERLAKLHPDQLWRSGSAELMPLYERLKATLLTSPKLAVDETPVPVLDPGRGKTKTGYFWAIAR